MTAETAPPDIEVRELTDEELKGAPPCDTLSWYLWEWRKARLNKDPHRCNLPSVARMAIHCNACGASYHLFLCLGHRWAFKLKKFSCRFCLRGWTLNGRLS